MAISSTLKALRVLSDPTRLRLVALLSGDELSVNELQEITGMGQSRISTHLRLLQETGLVLSRREGKRSFYRLVPQPRATLGDFPKSTSTGARAGARLVLQLASNPCWPGAHVPL